jgi:dephospho-CoA kinase
MLVVGVTGGIGAGKTTVSGMLAQLGARVIDADQIAREVVEKDPQVLLELVRAFGSGILEADGSLNRRELGRLAFEDPGRCERLNEILHPPILARLRDHLDQLRQLRYRGIVVVDAALLVEWGALRLLDKLVVVEAPEDVRRQRLMRHLGLSPMEIRSRMAAQLPPQEKSKKADYLIGNDVSLSVLRERVQQIWLRLMEDLSHKESRSS